MIFPSEQIKSDAEFTAACKQFGKEAIKLLLWIQLQCKEQAFLESTPNDKRNELYHKHRHLDSAVEEINNQIAAFAPDFSNK
ncbi:hypothetical protein IFY90_004253 [Salmonella enterica]|nr:hypothetical protein [Salmonella enterica]